MKIPALLLLPFLLAFLFCKQQPRSQAAMAYQPAAATNVQPVPGKINGLTFVAPPEPFPENPMPAVVSTGASWIAVVPYAFTRSGVPDVRFDENGQHWWGERPAGARETIRLAHASGIKVMLKPQVWIPRGWTGTLDFTTDAEWASWEAGYERYILRFAALADSTQADMFCIGTEFRTAIEKRPAFWYGLIVKIKQVYKGKLTYSSNWDDWDKVPFWKELDYIGLGGYFPLVEGETPEVARLEAAWQPIKERLRNYSKQQGKSVLFTEFGYLSVDGSGWRNWELESGIESRRINEQAQANCFEALFSTFQPEDWWAGGFMWKWFPNMQGHEGYPERDYTPQGKVGEKTLQKWYGGKN